MNDRFDRQVRFAPLGAAGQARLAEARAVVVGCGALGGFTCQALHRAGIGELVLVDRDVVDVTNLPRQVLFDERHAEAATPKVEAAAEVLARGGGPTRVTPRAAHLDADNVAELCDGADVVVDGTDNLPTRYLLNDFCVEEGRPWVYGGVVGAGGIVLAVQPGRGPCLRCVFPEPPPAGTLPTCDTAGVIAPAVGAVASLQAGLALRVLVDPDGLEPGLVELDAWNGDARRIAVPRGEDCPCCVGGARDFLDAPRERAIRLCGRNAVQVRGPARPVNVDALAERLTGIADDIARSGDLLRFAIDGVRLTVFPDGRALVEGTEEPERALAVVDRYVGL